MLIMRLKTGDRGEELRVGDATIHVRKVGEQKIEISIDAPPSVVISRKERPELGPSAKPVEE